MSKIRRRFMKEKEGKKILSDFFKRAKINSQQSANLKPPIELAKANGDEVFLISGKPIFAKSSSNLFPTLASKRLLSSMPKVIVDMGAVPHICNGADIMAPGIVHFEGNFNKGDFVVITDKKYQKPIAITIALYNIGQAKKLKYGKVLKNIHHVGDRLWNIIKQLT